jgi:hypothetical protein
VACGRYHAPAGAAMKPNSHDRAPTRVGKVSPQRRATESAREFAE